MALQATAANRSGGQLGLPAARMNRQRRPLQPRKFPLRPIGIRRRNRQIRFVRIFGKAQGLRDVAVAHVRRDVEPRIGNGKVPAPLGAFASRFQADAQPGSRRQHHDSRAEEPLQIEDEVEFGVPELRQ